MARPPGSAHPPAWYPDPHDPTRLRRWSGRAWTDDVRPLPDWLRTLRLSPGPGPGPVPRSSRRLWLASAALLALGAAVMVGLFAAREDDPDRLADRGLARAADARCADTNAVLAAASRPEGQSVADRVERITMAWEVAVEDLRDLPASEPGDAARLDRWFDTWDRWVALGHDYADALAAGDQAEADALLAEAEAPKAALSRFAAVNGMDACTF